MSRENYGLQAALIVMVGLTVVLAVAAFVFSRQYDEAASQARALSGDLRLAQAAVRSTRQENEQLKRFIAASPAVSVEQVERQFKVDMGRYAPDPAGQPLSYRSVLLVLAEAVRQNDAALVASRGTADDLAARYASRERGSQARLRQVEQAVGEARGELDREQQTIDAERRQMADDNSQIHQSLAATRQAADRSAADARQKYDLLWSEYQEVLRRLKDAEDKLERRARPVPQGQIIQVSQRLGTAWIDLGRADALEPLVGFDVYPAEAAPLDPESKKGQIEVSKVLDEHLAQARLANDRRRGAMIPGDRIHSPVWQPSRGR
jgi:hypothetical protein